MEIKHILAVLVVIMLSGCAAEVEEQPEETVTPEVTPPVEPEIPVEELVEEEPEVVGGAEDVQVLRGGFDPEELTVSAGTVVTWKNMDDRVHIVVLVGGERSPTLAEGDIFEYEFEEAGTFQVMDAVFGFKGTVIVE
ncbi:MAG: cupredoxin domain-containing protein [Nanoarchaeota archaeon]|nr:cupredoxin domain-containing protein [Nanoarchaeota archaeon]MBU4493336.1 cupredoxin domain-containing protein [Nanoarchaeota archaeon]